MSSYLLVIQYAPASLQAAMQKLRSKKEYAGLGLIILTSSPAQYREAWEDTDIPLHIVECDFKSGATIGNALRPFKEDIVGVLCRGDKQIQYLRRVLPFLPPTVLVASQQSLDTSTNKQLMRAAFARQYPEITPGFLHVHDASETTLDAVEAKLRYPVIIKPANLASSLLIQSCDNRQELSAMLKKAMLRGAEIYQREERDGPPLFIVEEYLEGDLYSIDAYVRQPEEIYFCPPVAYVAAKQLGIDDFFLYKRFVPTSLTAQEVTAANDVAAKAIKAVELQHSTAHVELIRTASGWKVIELGPRLGRFRYTMYAQAYGIDHGANDILIHLGRRPHIPARRLRYCAAYSIYPEQEGILQKIEGLDELESHPLLVYSKILARPGDMCHHAKHGGHALAEFIIASENREEYERAVQFVEKHVQAVID